MFQNSQIVDSSSNVNDAAESSWNELQQAFGSSIGGGGGTSIPASYVAVDLGGKMQHVEYEGSASGKKDHGYVKTEQSYENLN